MPNGEEETIGTLADYAALLADLKDISSGSDMKQWASDRAQSLMEAGGKKGAEALFCSKHDPDSGKCIEAKGQQE
jgi:hypothetical protein